MGYMTTMTILNDGYEDIKKNPKKLMDAIDDAMHGGKNGKKYTMGTNAYNINNGVVRIAPSYHMDRYHLFLCGENNMHDLGSSYSSKIDIEQQLVYIERAKDMLDNFERELRRDLSLIAKKSYTKVVLESIDNISKEDIIIYGDLNLPSKEGISKIGCYGKIFVSKEFLKALGLYDDFLLYAKSLDLDTNKCFILFEKEFSILTIKVGIAERSLDIIENYLYDDDYTKLYDKIMSLLD